MPKSLGFVPKFVLILVAAVMLASCSADRKTSSASPYRIVGYDTVNKHIDELAVDKLDVLIFAFARVKQGKVVLEDDAASRLQKLIALKASHPGLKVMISVGGWGAGGFSEAASTAAGRRKFAQSAARLVVSQHADGLDVDWEYPGNDQAGIAASPHDRAHFTALIKTLRSTLDKVVRTMATPEKVITC